MIYRFMQDRSVQLMHVEEYPALLKTMQPLNSAACSCIKSSALYHGAGTSTITIAKGNEEELQLWCWLCSKLWNTAVQSSSSRMEHKVLAHWHLNATTAWWNQGYKVLDRCCWQQIDSYSCKLCLLKELKQGYIGCGWRMKNTTISCGLEHSYILLGCHSWRQLLLIPVLHVMVVEFLHVDKGSRR